MTPPDQRPGTLAPTDNPRANVARNDPRNRGAVVGEYWPEPR
jgi:hypothetical protein